MEAYARQIRLPESPWDNLTDEEIVLLAQAGNSDAEEYLLQKYEKMVYTWTRSFSYRVEKWMMCFKKV